MLQQYFSLQLKLIHRKLKDFGLEPILAYIILPFLFVVISNFILNYSNNSKYIYAFLGIYQVLKIGSNTRNNFLKYVYGKSFFFLRCSENLLLILPFTILLLYKQEFTTALVLLSIAILVTFYSLSLKNNITIPTPFGKKPFEFILGFRKTFWVFPIIYYVTYQAISYRNFNLGIVCVFLSFLIITTYYQKLEKPYYIWIFSVNPKEFLLKKIKIGVVNALVITLPLILALAITFPDNITILLTIIILANLYLTAFVLAKYSIYPSSFGISQTVILIVSLIFPPALLIVIPYFYRQSINRIYPVLNDTP